MSSPIIRIETKGNTIAGIAVTWHPMKLKIKLAEKGLVIRISNNYNYFPPPLIFISEGDNQTPEEE